MPTISLCLLTDSYTFMDTPHFLIFGPKLCAFTTEENMYMVLLITTVIISKSFL